MTNRTNRIEDNTSHRLKRYESHCACLTYTLVKCLERLRKSTDDLGVPANIRVKHTANTNWSRYRKKQIGYKSTYHFLHDELKYTAQNGCRTIITTVINHSAELPILPPMPNQKARWRCPAHTYNEPSIYAHVHDTDT